MRKLFASSSFFRSSFSRPLFACLLMAGVSGTALMTPHHAIAQDRKVAVEEESATDLDSIFNANKIPTFTGAYLSGQIAESDSEIDEAIAFYKRALLFAPDNLETRRRLFNSLLISGEYEEAIVIADSLKDDAELAELSERALAVQTIRKREYRSTDRYLNLEEQNPVDSLVNQLLSAWAKFGDNKTDEAIAQITGLTGPQWYEPFKDFNMGMMSAAAGDREAAIAYFEALIASDDAIQITPDTYLMGIMTLATIHAQAGDKEKAAGILYDGRNIQAAYPPANALGKKIDDGTDLVFPVKNAQEGASAALYSIGGALNRDGNEDIVALYLQFARALNPNNAEALVMLGGIQEQLGKSKKSIEIYRSVPETSPMRRLSELQLGLNLADIGQIDEALEHLAALILEHPKDIRAYQGYGSILSREKRYQDVSNNFEAGIKAVGPIHNRSHWNLFYQLGISYERLKQWDKAEVAFLRALELSPNEPQVMNYLGYSWIDMNINLEEGMDMIRTAVELRPNDGYIVDSLGWAHFRQGQYEEAVRQLERAIELRPSDPTINDHLGDAYWRIGRTTEASFQWERALTNMADFDESLIPVLEKKIKEGLSEDTPTDG
jgi:tetratricopeptide (TPR) repeat protein